MVSRQTHLHIEFAHLGFHLRDIPLLIQKIRLGFSCQPVIRAVIFLRVTQHRLQNTFLLPLDIQLMIDGFILYFELVQLRPGSF